MSMSGVDERDVRPPFIEMLRRSFRAWWQGIVQMPALYAAVFVALAVLWVVETGFGYRLTQQIVPPQFWGLSTRLAKSALEAALAMPLCIALQLLTLRQMKPDRRAILRAFAAYYGWVMLVNIAEIVLTDAPAFLPGYRPPYVLLASLLAALIFVSVAVGRLWLIFPGIALGEHISFFRRAVVSWQQTQGHFWYVFGTLIVTTLVLAVPFGVAEYFERASGIAFAVAGPNAMSAGTVILAATSAAHTIMDETLGAAAAACLYRALVEGGGPMDVEGTAAHFT